MNHFRWPLALLFIFLFHTDVFGQEKKKDEPTSYRDDLTFAWKTENDSLYLMARSKQLAPIQVFFHSKSKDSLLQDFLLPPKDSLALMTVKSTEQDSLFREKISDSIRLSYYLGHPSLIKPDSTYLYRLPFKKGKKYRLTQGYFGKTSHYGPISRYALDFQLEVGEPVHAAREGLVIKAIDWFTKQGGEELKHSANRIVVMHDDGTFASYVHLKYKGTLVEVGDRVSRGQKIGISGLTGYTTGPHLHFVVRKERDLAIPIFFEGYEDQELKQGKRYKIPSR